jgi:hypothetical protein
MSRQPQPDAELVRYLALLAGREPAGGLLEIRYRHPDRHQRMRQHWHPAAHPARAAREILKLAEHTDVYVGAAPRRHRHGGRSAIHRAWVLWADLDQPNETDPLTRVPVAPGVIISSGTPGHRHLYWPLTQPLSVAQVERANEILARALHADSGAVLNAATILRPPGTHNFKHGHPSAVTLERFEPRAHTAAQILDGLPANAPAPPHAEALRIAASDLLLAIEPACYVQTLTGLRVPRSRKVSCPFHEDRTPSLHVYHQPAQGWACFGCGRGGSVYDLAGELWQLNTRGPEFVELRNRLHDLLLPETARQRHEGALPGRG